MWLHPLAAPSSRRSTHACHRPTGGHGHHRLQYLVSCLYQPLLLIETWMFSHSVVVTLCSFFVIPSLCVQFVFYAAWAVTGCYYCPFCWLLCPPVFVTMGVCSATWENVKVREQSNKTRFSVNTVNLNLSFSPSFSRPQRVVGLDSVLSLRAAAQQLADGVDPEALSSLFGPGFWSSSL